MAPADNYSVRAVSVMGLGMALLLLVGAMPEGVARAQGNSAHGEPTDRSDRRVEVHVKAVAADGKPLPAGSMVEISGAETRCGRLSTSDARAMLDERGEAVLRDLPACKVAVKVNLVQYLPVRKVVDLSASRPCAGGGGVCEEVSLVLDSQ